MPNMKPIGFVKNKIKAQRFGGFAKEISEIILSKKFARGLSGIEKYSHAIIIYWMHKIKHYDMLSRNSIKNLRKADIVEIKAGEITESK